MLKCLHIPADSRRRSRLNGEPRAPENVLDGGRLVLLQRQVLPEEKEHLPESLKVLPGAKEEGDC